MDRTLRAALVAGLIAFVAVAGLGLFLLPGATVGSLVAGAVAAALAVLLLLGASRRADSFTGPEHVADGRPDAEPRPERPTEPDGDA